ncbi:MAG: sterol desaturase family protein [Deltaproteobacteria bacterium]|nr:sterol desaturase family protein [Deltaproteobacteria bacterium]
MMITSVALVALGVLTWSFLEYVMHRFLGHDRRFIKKTPFGAEHTAHHSRGDYFAPTWKKAVFMLIVAALVGVPAWLVAGVPGLLYAGGLIGGYLAYEVFHRLLHVWAGVGPYARWARRHHFYHHFHDPKRNHGVTSPLWDMLFGTYARPERILVPERLAMRWLRDGEGRMRPGLERDWALR